MNLYRKDAIVFLSLLTVIIILAVQPNSRSLLQKPVYSVPVERHLGKQIQVDDVTHNWMPTALFHQQTSGKLTALTETLGAGVCVIDANRDGWMDLFFVGGSGHQRHYGKNSWWRSSNTNQLLLNHQGKHFINAGESAGFDDGLWGMGCAVGDLDNDGFDDIVVGGLNELRIYKNNGDASFSNVSADANLIQNGWHTGISLVDFNRDGLLDIYVSNYIQFEKDIRVFEQSSGFSLGNSAAFDAKLYAPQANHFYLNLGKGRFRNVAAEMGVDNPSGRSLGSRWRDLNGDGWLDLLVINGANSPSRVYLNHKGKDFNKGGKLFSSFELVGSHDMAWGDIIFAENHGYVISRERGFAPMLLSPAAGGDDYYQNIAWGVAFSETDLLAFGGWSALVADVDNDGFDDIYMANGLAQPDSDSPYLPQAQPNILFHNRGKGFHAVAESIDDSYSSRGVAKVDLNNDGLIELIVTNNNGPLKIFSFEKNSRNWFGLDFSKINDANWYNARVELDLGDRILIKQVRPISNFLSQSDPRLHVGLGDHTLIKQIKIFWDDGSVSVFQQVKTKRYYEVSSDRQTLNPIDYSALDNSELSIPVASSSDEELLYLFDIIIELPSTADQSVYLAAIWDSASAETRVYLLDKLSQYSVDFIRDHYWLLDRASGADESTIKLKLISLFKKIESEESIKPLIAMLRDEDVSVQCYAAETLRFFFAEEEAVTHYKYLAIKPLIQLLDSKSERVVECVSSALAESENIKAVGPLLRLAKMHNSYRVKAVAVRALGLIRDVSVLTDLEVLVSDKTLSIEVQSELVIALHRMGKDGLSLSINAAGVDQSANNARFLQLLSLLLVHPEGIVLPQDRLRRYFSNVIELMPSIDNDLLILTLAAIEKASLRDLNPFVRRYVHSPLPAVQIAAIQAQASIDNSAAEVTLNELSPIGVLLMAESIDEHSAVWPMIEDQLFQKNFNLEDIQKVLLLMPESIFTSFIDRVPHSNIEASWLDEIYRFCAERVIPVGAINKKFWFLLSSHSKQNYMDCYANGRGWIGAQDINSELSTRIIVSSILADSKIERFKKNYWLIKLAYKNPGLARIFLYSRLSEIDSRLYPELFSTLDSNGCGKSLATQCGKSVEAFLQKLLASQFVERKVKLQAAKLMVKSDAIDEVIAFLNGAG